MYRGHARVTWGLYIAANLATASQQLVVEACQRPIVGTPRREFRV